MRKNNFCSANSCARLARLLMLGALLIRSISESELQAATLNINLQITNILHHFTPPGFPFPGFPGTVSDEIQFAQPPLTNLNLQLYDTYRLRLVTPVVV